MQIIICANFWIQSTEKWYIERNSKIVVYETTTDSDTSSNDEHTSMKLDSLFFFSVKN